MTEVDIVCVTAAAIAAAPVCVREGGREGGRDRGEELGKGRYLGAWGGGGVTYRLQRILREQPSSHSLRLETTLPFLHQPYDQKQRL